MCKYIFLIYYDPASFRRCGILLVQITKTGIYWRVVYNVGGFCSMRYTVQYIPLSKIKPGASAQLTQRIRELRSVARDCMHLLVVRKSRKNGGYILVSGSSQYDFLKKNSKYKAAPCLVDQSKSQQRIQRMTSFIDRWRKRKLPYDVPLVRPERTPVKSWSIIRSFLKEEPRFKHLSRRQQVKVIRLGLRYKKTTVRSMKAKVDELLGR